MRTLDYKKPSVLPSQVLWQLLQAQRNELTESVVYSRLAARTVNLRNRRVLERIAADERRHYSYWKNYTRREVPGRPGIIFFYTLLARLLGLTFSVKLMEKGEELAQVNYAAIASAVPQARQVEAEEHTHETQLLALLDEEKLKYVGSMILGVNDALVELTGALAGFTLALSNTRLIAMTGLITGIAASLSMGTSEYLSTQAESADRDPRQASLYTGITYLLTVILLVLPYFLFTRVYLALGVTLLLAIIVISFFTFYLSVARDLPFMKRFLQMVGISLGVSAFTFIIGYLVKHLLGINI